MDDEIPDSEKFSQVDDEKDIQIKSFSCARVFQNEHIHFVRKRHFYGQIYAVHVYPNGSSSENEGYVSMKVSKVLKDPNALPDVGYDNITWSFSVMDINGRGRFYQSVAKESVVNLPYRIEIPKFMKRSFVLDRADELLPGDILTVRCEVSFVFYSIQALRDNLLFDLNPHLEVPDLNPHLEVPDLNPHLEVPDLNQHLKDSKKKISSENFKADTKFSSENDSKSEQDLMCNHTSKSDGAEKQPGGNLTHNESSKSFLNEDHSLYDNEEDMIYYMLIMLGFLHEYSECKQSRRLDSKDLEFQIRLISKILVNTDNADEVIKTYMWTDPVFKTYIRLKSKVKDILNKNPMAIKEEENLENEKYSHHPIYTRGSYLTFRDSWSLMRKIYDVIKCVNNSSDQCDNKHPVSIDEHKYLWRSVTEISEGNSMWEYLFEAIKYDEPDDSEEEDMADIDCNKPTEWNLQIQTKDGVIFRIPFKEGKETFGSKLVASSSVFESMLRNPMMERLSKKVHLPDTGFRTFRNFLQFLQDRRLVTGALTELCDLYEFADKYNVEDLMLDCGLMFMPFLNEETVSVVEALACMHSDDFLLGSIKTWKKEHSQSLIPRDNDEFVVKSSTNSSLKEKRPDFDFYQ